MQVNVSMVGLANEVSDRGEFIQRWKFIFKVLAN